jgi:hypothetical protein
MTWKEGLNRTLARATGYELRRQGSPAASGRRRHPGELLPGDRLLARPAFVMCSVRSGSTLLRVLLDSHSEVHAPHELHLRHISVRVRGRYTRRSLDEAGLDADKLRFLLWDRLLHRELAHSGKRLLVNKTPSDVFVADRILECWPDARFIFLLRHPLAIMRSRRRLRPSEDPDRNIAKVLRYCEAVQEVRETHPGLTVRYEDLTADPETQTRRLCDFLGVAWEPQMLDYGGVDHGRYRPGMGDWNEKLRSGRIQPPPPLPPASEIPPALHALCAAWGYLPQPAPTAPLHS